TATCWSSCRNLAHCAAKVLLPNPAGAWMTIRRRRWSARIASISLSRWTIRRPDMVGRNLVSGLAGVGRADDIRPGAIDAAGVASDGAPVAAVSMGLTLGSVMS